MLYSCLFLTALLSQVNRGVATEQTRAMTTRGSMAALNNLVVLGNADHATLAGSVSFSYYTYDLTGGGAVITHTYVQADSGTAANTIITPASTDLAGSTFLGLGRDVAIADTQTVFVSQTSIAKQTGRVVLYEGNTTSFRQTQLLVPYDGKHRLDSAAAFGESIAAKYRTLAAGCQNCNTSAPIYSGAVYVYKPNKEGRWSESQVLTADGVMFLGEQVAMHESVLVAAGDDAHTFSRASDHNYGNVANTVVVFEEKGPKFEQRQVLMPMAGGKREAITGVTVFDETIAITTKGSDTTGTTQRDKVYIYYPMNERFGLKSKDPKGKPSPQQWTNIQILTSANAAHIRYGVGSPDTSISGNELQYLTTDGTNVAKAKAIRSCVSCKFGAPTVTAITPVVANVLPKLTSDQNAFYGFSLAVDNQIDHPDVNSIESRCITLNLADQYNDGWGIASLVVSSPDGREDKFTLQCTTHNPMVFKYCPTHFVAGKYHIHIDKGEETPFGWELFFHAGVNGAWYYGDRHTHMDFLWDDKYGIFVFDNAKGLLPPVDTCEVCSATKPVAHADPHGKPGPKHRSLSNLRALHHKGVTSSPTFSHAPTFLSTDTGYQWNEFVIDTGAAWFNGVSGKSIKFMVSDPKGKKLIRSGTSCFLTAGAVTTTCWVDLPDGDYSLRVGAGISGTSATSRHWTFCGIQNRNLDSEIHFSIIDQQCYLGSFTEAATTCTSVYKASFYLNVDVLLSGGASVLSSADESSLNVALTETVVSVLGSVPTSTKVLKQFAGSSGLVVTMLLGFDSTPDVSALDNFVMDSSSASSLLKYELIGTQTLAEKFLEGGVSSVSILSVSTSDQNDYSKIDESSFQTVTDHVWKTDSVQETPDMFNMYAKYVAQGAYAVVAVAAVLAVSLFAKRAMTKSPAAETTETPVLA